MSGADGLSILAVTLRYPPYVAGGYELLTRDAVESLRSRGHRVQVLAGRGTRFDGADVLARLEPELDGDVDLFERSFRASNLERFRLHFLRLANYRTCARALAEVRPDAVLFFNLGLVSLAPVLAARHAGVPTLGYVADPWPANHWLEAWRADRAAAEAKAGRLRFLEAFWRFLRELVDLGPLLVASRYLAERLTADGVAATSLEVLPLALSPELEAASADSPVSKRAAGDPLRVLCLSSLWPGKGQDVLLAGASSALEHGASLEVRLAGGGEPGYRAELERQAAAPGLAGRVSFLGPLSAREVAVELRAAHVLCLPSRWPEPFGLATIEGQAFGRAVVATKTGATSELVEHGVDGWLVPPDDAPSLGAALERLARDDELRVALGRAAQARARREHARERFVGGLDGALRRVVGQRGTG